VEDAPTPRPNVEAATPRRKSLRDMDITGSRKHRNLVNVITLTTVTNHLLRG